MDFQTNDQRAKRINLAVELLQPLADALKGNEYTKLTEEDLRRLDEARELLELARLKPIYKQCNCGKWYNPDREALSRKDNKPICSDCGTMEALSDPSTKSKI